MPNALSSVLVACGDTRVLISVHVETGVPSWRRVQEPGAGWLTAEYAMLPGATHVRQRRERNGASGRTQEIQRLIGRSLRGICQLRHLGERTLHVDCDVLNADGGTRTAAISGAYVALERAVRRLRQQNILKRDVTRDGLVAVSAGVVDGHIRVDLDYTEDSNAATDLNVVRTHSGAFLELQATAERAPFSRETLDQILNHCNPVLDHIAALQREAIALPFE